MEWVAVITLVLQLFGPLIVQLIEKWLNKSASEIAAPESFATPEAGMEALFDKAISEAGIIGRMVLRIVKPIAVKRAQPVFAKAKGQAVEVPPLTADESIELDNLGV